jgi:hypothetical protein
VPGYYQPVPLGQNQPVSPGQMPSPIEAPHNYLSAYGVYPGLPWETQFYRVFADARRLPVELEFSSLSHGTVFATEFLKQNGAAASSKPIIGSS